MKKWSFFKRQPSWKVQEAVFRKVFMEGVLVFSMNLPSRESWLSQENHLFTASNYVSENGLREQLIKNVETWETL